MKKNTFLTCLLLAIAIPSYAQKAYNNAFRKAVLNATGHDFRKYKIPSLPTDNYGVLTCYRAKDNFLCDMWKCFTQKPADSVALISLNGYVAVGLSNYEIDFDDSASNQYSLDFAVPKLVQLIGIDISGSIKANKHTIIKFGKLYVRQAYPDSVNKKISQLDDKTSSVKRAFNSKKLVMVYSDVVASSLSVSVKLDKNTSAKVNAKIGDSSTKAVVKNILSNDSLNLSIARTLNGEYSFTVNTPVIIAVWRKRQPRSGQEMENKGFEAWEDDIDDLPIDYKKTKKNK